MARKIGTSQSGKTDQLVMSNIYVQMNGWREILARTFEGFSAQDNVSPEWMVNPATSRRLKLDRFYPDAGFAIRFVGLTAKGQGRQSDWDVLENQQRDQTRAELCRVNGVQLFLVDPSEEPTKQIDLLSRLLTRAIRTVAQTSLSDRAKRERVTALEAARSRSLTLRDSVAKNPDQMLANLADSWRDREANLATSLSAEAVAGSYAPPPSPSGGFTPVRLVSGLRVVHARFGEGVVTEIAGEGDNSTVSILFDGEQPRTFLTALVQDKLVATP